MFTPQVGWTILMAYGLAAVFVIAIAARQRGRSKADFLVAGRRLGTWEAALSIAATWIWAPALFVASQKAYTHGVVGLFWFTAPNIACLIVFGRYALRIREQMPDQYSLTDYMRLRYSGRVQALYLLQQGGLAVCCFAVQLLAGGAVMARLTGLPYGGVLAAMVIIALSYSLWSGLKASVVTDYVQMLLIAAVALVLVPWAVIRGGGAATIVAGLAGRSGEWGVLETSLFFGVPATIGLMAGPFGDQSYWQRVFAIRRGHVRRAFTRAALIFAIVPLTLGLLGFMAAGAGLDVPDVQMVNVESVVKWLPAWALVPFVLMLLSGLISTLDSALAAVSSLAGHDILNALTPGADTDRAAPWIGRLAMLLLAAVGTAIALIPGMKIIYLWLFYGTLRAATLLPTMLTIRTRPAREPAMFYGLLGSLLIGVPLFGWANFTGRAGLTVVGALVTLLVSGVIVGVSIARSKDA